MQQRKYYQSQYLSTSDNYHMLFVPNVTRPPFSFPPPDFLSQPKTTRLGAGWFAWITAISKLLFFQSTLFTAISVMRPVFIHLPFYPDLNLLHAFVLPNQLPALKKELV